MIRQGGISRRALLIGLPVILSAPFLQATETDDRTLQAIEKDVGGRLGVAALNTANGRYIRYKADELWPLCSTFKFLLAAAVLNKVDSGKERLDSEVAVSRADVLDYAPAVKANLIRGRMSVFELCQAAVSLSDNAAANLLFQIVGGPPGLTLYLRSLGDKTTSLNRIEPFVNEARPGDTRDTSSPAAMLGDMEKLLLRDALSEKSRELLTDWLIKCTTGSERLRAGLPFGWKVGDKTGTGDYGSTNDIAIAWPPGRKPLLIAAYLTESTAPATRRNDALAEVGRFVTATLVGQLKQ